MPGDINRVDVRRAAMDMLARREHAQGELTRKLEKRFGSTDDVIGIIREEVVRLEAEGLQSDSRLAEAFIRARVGRGQGPVRIRSELRSRGVPDDVIEQALAECEVDWFDLAARVSEKRFGEALPADAKERAKRARFLQQRGFSFDHIRGH